MLWQLNRCPKPLGTTHLGLSAHRLIPSPACSQPTAPPDDVLVPGERRLPVVYTAETWHGYKFGTNTSFASIEVCVEDAF